MSKTTVAILAALVTAVLPSPFATLSAQSTSQLMNGTPLPFYVYQTFKSPKNHYAPSGWMGDYGDLRLNDRFKDAPKETKTVIQVAYNAKGSQGAGWAGIYWQNPANNWGNSEGGYNLNGANRLLFRARGEKGGEHISEFKVGGIEGNFRDSASASIGPLKLSKEWDEYEIDLKNQELSNISGGFCLVMTREQNPAGATVYLDNIRFE